MIKDQLALKLGNKIHRTIWYSPSPLLVMTTDWNNGIISTVLGQFLSPRAYTKKKPRRISVLSAVLI